VAGDGFPLAGFSHVLGVLVLYVSSKSQCQFFVGGAIELVLEVWHVLAGVADRAC
jgi:hypothetical protein